jgi:proteasome lid subunit RPN8/RPN11
MNALTIPDSLFQQIAAHGQRTYPEECCGVMLGKQIGEERLVQDIAEIDNTQDTNRRRRFLVSAAQYRRAEQQAAERKMDLLGFYHSHPDHPAVPSAFDTEHALPWFTYVIVSVEKGRAGHATAWMLEEDRSRFVEQLLTKESRASQVSTLK